MPAMIFKMEDLPAPFGHYADFGAGVERHGHVIENDLFAVRLAHVFMV